MKKELKTELDNRVKEFVLNRAKEVELVLAYELKEQTEMIDNKLVWKTEIQTHLRKTSDVLKEVENEINMALERFEDTTNIKKDYLMSLNAFKNNLNDIFRKKDLP